MASLKSLVKFVLVFMYFDQYCHCFEVNNNYTLPHVRQGGWTPLPAKHSKLLSEKMIAHVASDSIASVVATKPQQSHQQSHQQSQQQSHQPKQSQQLNHNQQKKKQDPDMLPIPVIKPHAHGATLGFNLPEQGLTLYLDINELATKPLAQNIGLSIVNHDSHQAQSSTQPLSAAHPATHLQQNNPSSNFYSNSGSTVSQLANKVQVNNDQLFAKPAVQKKQKTSRLIGSYEGNAPSSQSAPSVQSKQNNKYRVGYMDPVDLHNVLKQVGLRHSQQQESVVSPKIQSPAQFVMSNKNKVNEKESKKYAATNGHTVSINKVQASSGYENFGQNLNAPSVHIYSPQREFIFDTKSKNLIPSDIHLANIAPKSQQSPQSQQSQQSPQSSSFSVPNTYSYSIPRKTDTKAYPPQEIEPQRPIKPQTQDTDNGFDDNEVPIKSTPPQFLPPPEDEVQQKVQEEENREFTTKPSVPNEDRQSVEPPKHVAKETEETEDDGEDIRQNILVPPVMPPIISTPSTNAHFVPQLPVQTQELIACPSKPQVCEQNCLPNAKNIVRLTNNLKETLKQLNADLLINTFPSLEDELQNFIDFSTTGYTLIVPSNKAISRLPPSLIDFWLKSQEKLNVMIDNHLLETAQTLEDMRVAQIIQPRAANAGLRVNSAHNDSYTINGQLLSAANQMGPSGGMIHVIDGILFPTADKDIMETLKTCNRWDGFVTLAEGTGFSDTLKQTGPFTVFVPSNEALQKVPDADLDIIRNNMTALREFLKYHVARGSYYSNDLRDGQFIPSLLDNHEIQVGVRTDGCSRRLVEANVSPLYRADIPASNGVIHVVDWILKPTDRDWCEGVILPR